MSRKHFQIFADEIKWIDDLAERERMAIVVARCCKQCNPNFNFDKFFKACGLDK